MYSNNIFKYFDWLGFGYCLNMYTHKYNLDDKVTKKYFC